MANVYESKIFKTPTLIQGKVYVIVMEELDVPRKPSFVREYNSGLFESYDKCCGFQPEKPIQISRTIPLSEIYLPPNKNKMCGKVYNNLIGLNEELNLLGIEWYDISIDNFGIKNNNLALLDLGGTSIKV